jgi:hypothetical protein
MWTYHNTQVGLWTKTSEQVFWQSASRHPQWHTLYEVPKSTNLKATKYLWHHLLEILLGLLSTVMVGIVPVLIKAIVLLVRCHWRHVSNAKYGQMALWMKETNTSSLILKNLQIVTTEWQPLGIFQKNKIRKFHKLQQQTDNHRTLEFLQKDSRFMKLQPLPSSLPSMLHKSGSRFMRTWYCNTKPPFWLAQYPLLAYGAVS